VAVIKALAQALGLSVEDVLAQAAGVTGDATPEGGTEAAIRSDPKLDQSQKSALLAVYRSMVDGASQTATSTTKPTRTRSAGGTAGSDPPDGATR